MDGGQVTIRLCCWQGWSLDFIARPSKLLHISPGNKIPSGASPHIPCYFLLFLVLLSSVFLVWAPTRNLWSGRELKYNYTAAQERLFAKSLISLKYLKKQNKKELGETLINPNNLGWGLLQKKLKITSSYIKLSHPKIYYLGSKFLKQISIMGIDSYFINWATRGS